MRQKVAGWRITCRCTLLSVVTVICCLASFRREFPRHRLHPYLLMLRRSRRAYHRYCAMAAVDGPEAALVLDLLLVAQDDAPEFSVVGAGRTVHRTDGFGKTYVSYVGKWTYPCGTRQLRLRTVVASRRGVCCGTRCAVPCQFNGAIWEVQHRHREFQSLHNEVRAAVLRVCAESHVVTVLACSSCKTTSPYPTPHTRRPVYAHFS